MLLIPPCITWLVLFLASQEGRVFTPETVAELRTVTSVAMAPDGRRAAYTLSVPRRAGQDDDGAPWVELHVVEVEGGRSRPFVAGQVNVSALAWTSTGREIAFLTRRGDDKEPALYLIPVDGGEARRVLSLGGGIRAFGLAPDGKRVVCIAAPPPDQAREARRAKGFRQEVYEEEQPCSELWVAPLGGDTPPRSLPFEGHPSAVSWSPVDDRLLISWAPTPLVDDGYMESRVAVLDGGDGTVLARIENPGKLGSVRWSPDGRHVALIAAADRNDPNAGRLCLASAEGGVPVELRPGFEGDALDFAWQGTDSLLVVTHVGVWSRLERWEIDEADPRLIVGTAVLVDTGGPILTALDLAGDGRTAAFLGNAPEYPSEVFARRDGRAPERLTHSNPGLQGLRHAVQEPVSYSARDGLALEGVLIAPLDRTGETRVPLLLNVHGGPEAHVSNGWLTSYSNPGQVAAARGFAVFQPNYRGSTGRGVAFSKLGQADAAGKEFDDLVDAVDHLVALGLVDRERVGVTGGSYGGYATAWCSTRFSERFAAGVMFVGIADKISKVGTTDIPEEEARVHALGRPWDDWQALLERSPIFHADKSRTPLLILHGKDDPRVNPGQSLELYRHLKLRGQAPVRLVLYPGEGHGNRKAAARLDYARRSLQWFEHYLMGPGGEMPPADLPGGTGDSPDG